VSLAIRSARPGEGGLVLAFIRALAEYERLAHAMEATEEVIETALFGENPRVFCDIAEWDGVPAGFALWFYNFSTFLGVKGLWLEDLFVRPAYRGRGHGKALLLHVARIAHQRNCGRFEWAVLDWNEPSIRFYKSLGAQPLDDWTIMRVTGPALHALARME